MSPDGACERENARIVLYEAENDPAHARVLISRGIGGARAPLPRHPHPRRAGGPGWAGVALFRACGGLNYHPAPSCLHVQALLQCTSSCAVRRANGGTNSDARPHFELGKDLKVHFSQSSGGVVRPVMVCPAM